MYLSLMSVGKSRRIDGKIDQLLTAVTRKIQNV